MNFLSRRGSFSCHTFKASECPYILLPSLVLYAINMCTLSSGMNINQRKYNQHVEYEQDTDSVFLAELWTTSPIAPLLSHLKDQTTVPLTKRVLSICLEALETWLRSVMPNEMVEDQVSFHIPLHRSLATFISHAVNVQKVDLSQIMPPDNLIRWILSHPLRIQVCNYQYFYHSKESCEFTIFDFDRPRFTKS